MLLKMKSPLCLENKVWIAPTPPPDYSKENLLATFAPQRNLTPEQIFWSIDDKCQKEESEDLSSKNNFSIGQCRTCRPLVSGLRLFKTYNGESFKAQELRGKVHRDRQFCDSDLEIAFRKHSCFVRDMNGVDLLKGSHSTNLYMILIDDMMKSSPVCLLSKASKIKSWLWHRRLNHLNFGIINDLARKEPVRGLPRLKFERIIFAQPVNLEK
ncbi:integrase, catalytic region, zinc finger, CCHC-type containing protein [Tanacetum coccineum]